MEGEICSWNEMEIVLNFSWLSSEKNENCTATEKKEQGRNQVEKGEDFGNRKPPAAPFTIFTLDEIGSTES